MSRVLTWDGVKWSRPGEVGSSEEELAYDWSEGKLPWIYDGATKPWLDNVPSGAASVVPIQVNPAKTFRQNLQATIAAAPGRVIVELGEGTYTLTKDQDYDSGTGEYTLFARAGGTTWERMYAFAFFDGTYKLRGLIGQGPDKTIITWDSNGYNSKQMTALQSISSGGQASPLQTSVWRFDSNSGSNTTPVFIGGLTFRGTDQGILSTYTGTPLGDSPINTPQPAPYAGIMHQANNGGHMTYSHVRFQATGHASYSAPPYETGQGNSQRSYTTYIACEFDGRLATEVNPTRPRRSGVVMFNDEYNGTMVDCWMHHNALSRYAVNDENYGNSGTQYNLTRCKIENVVDNSNIDPVYGSLGGFDGYPACAGFESTKAAITMTDCIFVADGSLGAGTWRVQNHLSLTKTSAAARPGGRLQVIGGEWRCSNRPGIDKFLTIRVPNGTEWYSDGLATTINVRDSPGSSPKTAYTVNNSQYHALTTASLASAGITPQTHYIARIGS